MFWGPRSGVLECPCGRPAKVTGAAGATHPVQVEALGAARGLLGAGAHTHGGGPAPPRGSGTAARTQPHQRVLALSALDYQILVT